MKTTRNNQYAVLYRGFGKWNWYTEGTFSKATIKGAARDCAKIMKSKVRIVKATRALRAGRSAGASGRRPVLPLEADANVSARRVFLGSTLEFMQREYFSEPQPKRDQRDGI